MPTNKRHANISQRKSTLGFLLLYVRSEGACHGNYPRACHTKRPLIRRRKSGSPFIQSSARLFSTECSPAVSIYFNGVFLTLLCHVRGTSFTPQLFHLHFTWCVLSFFFLLPAAIVRRDPQCGAALLNSGSSVAGRAKLLFNETGKNNK